MNRPFHPGAATGSGSRRSRTFLSVSGWRGLFWKRLLKNRLAAAGGGVLLLVFLLLAVAAPLVAPHKIPLPRTCTIASNPRRWPIRSARMISARDVLSRVIHGARISLRVGITAVLIALVVGVPIGLASGYWGGALDQALMRAMDLMLAFPSILLAIAIVAILGTGAGKRDAGRRNRGGAAVRAAGAGGRRWPCADRITFRP